MPLLTLNFEPETGPFLEVGLFLPLSMFPQRTQTPAGARIRFLIDTGAACTSISPQIAADLGLPSIGKIPLRSVTHEVTSTIYLADMLWTIGPHQTLSDIRLMEFPMAGHGIDGLLGRDILSSCLLSLNGPYKTLTLAF